MWSTQTSPQASAYIFLSPSNLKLSYHASLSLTTHVSSLMIIYLSSHVRHYHQTVPSLGWVDRNDIFYCTRSQPHLIFLFMTISQTLLSELSRALFRRWFAIAGCQLCSHPPYHVVSPLLALA